MEFHSGLTTPLLEKRIVLDLGDDIKVKGFIDKILLREKMVRLIMLFLIIRQVR